MAADLGGRYAFVQAASRPNDPVKTKALLHESAATKGDFFAPAFMTSRIK